MTKTTPKDTGIKPIDHQDYTGLLTGVSVLLEQARHAAARSVNAILTATYWEIGRRIVEFEQQGSGRAKYGKRLLERLAKDLTCRFGRGFGYSNLNLIRQFYRTYHYRRPILQSPIGESEKRILQTVSGESIAIQKGQTLSDLLPSVADSLKKELKISQTLSAIFPLSWSHYVRLLALDDEAKRDFYEEEARRAGWSVRQLDRQINSMLYERIALSDLLFYHRGLRCLVAIDFKAGKFTHADAGQMNLYLNYLRENEMIEGEEPPVGLILCSEKDETVVHYALGGLNNKVFASRYKLQLPAPEILKRGIEAERRRLEIRILGKSL